MRLPNLFVYKNLKALILVPFLLLVFGIYFSATRLTLDTSLRGGIQITIQTPSNISPVYVQSRIASEMHIIGAEVKKSPGGLTILLPVNESLAKAESYLASFYAAYGNYSSVQLNYSSLLAQSSNSSNATIKDQLSKDSALMTSYMQEMRNYSMGVIEALQPFGIKANSTNYTNTSITGMENAAQKAYAKASSIYESKLLAELKSVVNFSGQASFEEVTPTLGKYFLSQFGNILIIAFILVFLSVFVIFRSFVPSLTVTFGAVNDMIFALGMMALIGIPLGVSSIAGLLMIIGYAIDTDVLTAIRILKRNEGTVEQRAYESMRTGLTMTSSAILSFLVLFVVSLIAYVPTYYEISGIVLMGLIGDIFTTWFGNAPLLMLYKRRKERT